MERFLKTLKRVWFVLLVVLCGIVLIYVIITNLWLTIDISLFVGAIKLLNYIEKTW
jgi:hypothetical protein